MTYLVLNWTPRRRRSWSHTLVATSLATRVAAVASLFVLAVVSVSRLFSHVLASLDSPSAQWSFVALLALIPVVLVLGLFLWIAINTLLRHAAGTAYVSKFATLRVTLLVGVVSVSALAALLFVLPE